MSATRPVSRKRDVVETHDKLKKARDPRFDPMSGGFKKDQFSKSYGFLADKRDEELSELAVAIAKAEKKRGVDPAEIESLKQTLERKRSQKAESDKRRREEQAIQAWKREEKAKQTDGKKAWHLKPSARKELLIKAQYDELASDRGRLRKAIEKKQRKIDQKDKKLLPTRR